MKFVFLRKRYLVFYVYIAIYKEEKSSIALATVSFYSEIERKKGLFIIVISNGKWYYIHRRINDLRFEYDYHNIQFYGGKRF